MLLAQSVPGAQGILSAYEGLVLWIILYIWGSANPVKWREEVDISFGDMSGRLTLDILGDSCIVREGV